MALVVMLNALGRHGHFRGHRLPDLLAQELGPQGRTDLRVRHPCRSQALAVTLLAASERLVLQLPEPHVDLRRIDSYSEPRRLLLELCLLDEQGERELLQVLVRS